MPGRRVAEWSAQQPENVFFPIFLTLPDIIIFRRSLLQNEYSPMLVTLFGIVTFVRLMQL